MSYAAYHAEDWATGETDAAIREEIKRVDAKINHTYTRSEVGCAHFDYVRSRTLTQILATRQQII